MFKKIASIILAAVMVGSTAVVAASAAEADEAVAAAENSAVAAADDSSVAAADDSSVAAADNATVGDGNKIYFEVNPDLWKNFNTITLTAAKRPQRQATESITTHSAVGRLQSQLFQAM